MRIKEKLTKKYKTKDLMRELKLLELYNGLNQLDKKEKNKSVNDLDHFCETLSEMNSWLDIIELSGESRRKVSKLIEELKQYYIEAELDSLMYKKNGVKTKRRTK